jgi:hypothetical protein
LPFSLSKNLREKLTSILESRGRISLCLSQRQILWKRKQQRTICQSTKSKRSRRERKKKSSFFRFRKSKNLSSCLLALDILAQSVSLSSKSLKLKENSLTLI